MNIQKGISTTKLSCFDPCEVSVKQRTLPAPFFLRRTLKIAFINFYATRQIFLLCFKLVSNWLLGSPIWLLIYSAWSNKLGAFMENTWRTVVILEKWKMNWKMEMQNNRLLSSLSMLLRTSEFIITHEHLQRLPLQVSGELLVKL